MYERINANLRRLKLLTDDEITFFNAQLERIKVGKRIVYYRAGERNDYLSFVNYGLLKGTIFGKNGKEAVIHFPKEDWWVAETSSFYMSEPSMFQFETIEETELLVIRRDKMKILVEKYPKFESIFHDMLKRYIMAFHERYVNMVTLSANERYSIFIEKYPDLVQRVPQKLIASYLNVTPEFLSKLRSNK